MKNMERNQHGLHEVASVVPVARTPLARILAHEAEYWTSVSELQRRDGWVLFHNSALIPRLDPNHAGDFRAAAGTGDTIAQQIIEFYRALGAMPLAYVDALSTPSDLIERLLRAGFRELPEWASDLMLYVGPDLERPSLHVVEVVETDADRSDWASIVEMEATVEDRLLLRQLYVRQISDPRMTAYIARVDGCPASRCELFASGRLRRVEAVHTLETYRGRGLATAVLRRAILDSLARGDVTYIYAEHGGPAQRLYHRLGFRTVARNVIRGFAWEDAKASYS